MIPRTKEEVAAFFQTYPKAGEEIHRLAGRKEGVTAEEIDAIMLRYANSEKGTD